MKRFKNILITVVFIALTAWLFIKIQSLPSLSKLFTSKSVTIQNTTVVVKQIQALSQLVTVSLYEEIVVDTNASVANKIRLPLMPDITIRSEEKTLVMIGKVTAHIGIDLAGMSNTDISGNRDSIHIFLPQAKVLDVIINPSDVSVFIERGEWDNKAVSQLKSKMQHIAATDAQSRGLFQQSENKAKQLLTNFFMAAGYKKVVIQFKRNAALTT